MTEGQIKVMGHLTFVFVVVLLIGTFFITTGKTRESFASDVTKYSVTLFYQENCGHCHDMLRPANKDGTGGPVATVAAAVTDFLSTGGDGKNCNVTIDFSKAVPSGAVDVNDTKNQPLVQTLGVTYTPFLVLTDAAGKKISEFTGPRSCQGIAAWLSTTITCIPRTVCPYSTS